MLAPTLSAPPLKLCFLTRHKYAAVLPDDVWHAPNCITFAYQGRNAFIGLYDAARLTRCVAVEIVKCLGFCGRIVLV